MSNRSMVEINHDIIPYRDSDWAEKLVAYIRSGDPRQLPEGITFFNIRHHTDPCPLGDPPYGWDNDHPRKI